MTRRAIPFSIAAAFGVAAANAQGGDPIMATLKASMEQKKGVSIAAKGQLINMLVTSVSDQFVEGRSQQYSRIVVRVASIDAVSMS